METGTSLSYYMLPALIEISFVHSSERYEVRELLIATPRCLYLVSSNLRYGPGASSSLIDEQELRERSCIGRELTLNLAHADQPLLEINGREIPAEVAVVRVIWLPLREIVIRTLLWERDR
ncbi:MAG: hypothetical protein ABDH61_03210 [Acidilobaceae archaeon]